MFVVCETNGVIITRLNRAWAKWCIYSTSLYYSTVIISFARKTDSGVFVPNRQAFHTFTQSSTSSSYTYHHGRTTMQMEMKDILVFTTTTFRKEGGKLPRTWAGDIFKISLQCRTLFSQEECYMSWTFILRNHCIVSVQKIMVKIRLLQDDMHFPR